MIVDFSAKLYGTDRHAATIGNQCPFCGSRHPEGGEDLTLKSVAVTALLVSGKEQTAEDKKRRYDLLRKIDAGDKVALESQDQTFLKEAIGQSPFNALIAGQCSDWIEGRRPFCCPEPEAPGSDEDEKPVKKRKVPPEAA